MHASDVGLTPSTLSTNSNSEQPRTEARPFLKWAGGKRQLLAEILTRFPSTIGGRYFEPFIGGGAVFFALTRLHSLTAPRLSDSNNELVEAYCTVRDSVDDLISALRKHENQEAYYYQVR